MSKAERTRKFIIEQTAHLFNTKGYAATSLADITEATGLTKGSIYGNFENKDAVSEAVFRYNSDRLLTHIDRSFSEDKPNARVKLLSHLEFYRKNWLKIFENGGCPVLNTAIEADDTFPALKLSVKQVLESWAVKIIEVLEEGKTEGIFKKEVDSESYAYLFITLIEGGILLAKTTGKQVHLYRALDRIIQITESEIDQ